MSPRPMRAGATMGTMSTTRIVANAQLTARSKSMLLLTGRLPSRQCELFRGQCTKNNRHGLLTGCKTSRTQQLDLGFRHAAAHQWRPALKAPPSRLPRAA